MRDDRPKLYRVLLIFSDRKTSLWWLAQVVAGHSVVYLMLIW